MLQSSVRITKFLLYLVFATLIWISIAQAVSNKVDPTKSRIDIVFKQMEVPVQASFKKFVALIEYDALHLEKSKANVDINMTSLELPAPEYNQEVLKKEWFNAAQFGHATFNATSMKLLAPGKLEVSGNLSIKGKTISTTFPLFIKTENGMQVFEGSLPIKRLAFNIGEGEWKDTSMLADEVIIKFKITTTP